MARLSVASWIGNAAAVMCGSWGSISSRARDASCSRQTIYKHAKRVEQAVSDLQDGTPGHCALLEENEQLRRENAELWETLDSTIDFPEAKQQQFVATASAMGLSLTQILTLLAIILPATRCPSRATIGRWVESWCTRASQVLKVLDNACKKLVLVMCIDEIFFRRQPVLVGV